jgi:sugar lactone lactonase YvrE
VQEYQAAVVRSGLSFGEAPRWRHGRLFYSDFYRHGVFSMAPDGSDERREVTVAAQPSGIGWLPDGSLLVVSMIDQRVLRVRDGVTTEYCDISEYCGFWANDMLVSPRGVAYVGNFGFDLDTYMRDAQVEGATPEPPAHTGVVVIGEGGHVLQVADELSFPNGMVQFPDERTLVVAETTSFRLTAFDVAADGTLSNRRLFAQLDGVPPDGICLDADGQIWVANPLGDGCVRVAEGGAITATVHTSHHTYACMLGGDDRRSLYVICAPTSSRFEIPEQTTPRGTIEVAHVDVPGAGWP